MKHTNRLLEIGRGPWLLLMFVLAALALGGCASGQPQILLETESFDFGNVINGDVVSKNLLVTNTGSAPLVIESVSTTCGCTTATLEPMTLEPNAQGVLHIEFDSGAHGPELNGVVSRQIYLASNDPDLPDARIEFTATVLPSESQ